MATPIDPRLGGWIAKSFEELVKLDVAGKAPVFDVLVVGSGYGGAVAADHFSGLLNDAGQPVTVCVLERGKEYVPGMFPTGFAELPGHVRIATQSGQRQNEGLFDFRLSETASALVANGLG